jgi:hypothetical protein
MNKLTNQEIDTRLLRDGRGYTRIDQYVNFHHKIKFKCPSGHLFSIKPSHLLSNVGCKICNGGSRRSREDINHELAASNRPVRIIGEYINNKIKTLFDCGNGHQWLAEPNSVVKQGRGCPYCAVRGGYKRNLPGWIYVLKFNDFIKYGITNNAKERLSGHKRCGDYDVVLIEHYENGDIAWNWEQHIKKTFGGRYISKSVMPNGWTETLPIEYMDRVISFKVSVTYLT